jgi:hypothetical protein
VLHSLHADIEITFTTGPCLDANSVLAVGAGRISNGYAIDCSGRQILAETANRETMLETYIQVKCVLDLATTI